MFALVAYNSNGHIVGIHLHRGPETLVERLEDETFALSTEQVAQVEVYEGVGNSAAPIGVQTLGLPDGSRRIPFTFVPDIANAKPITVNQFMEKYQENNQTEDLR